MAEGVGQYTASSWVRDYLLAELGEIIGDCTSFIPAPIWVTKGGAFGVKATVTGLTIVIPERPDFVQFPGLPYSVGLVIDYHHEIVRGQDTLHSGEGIGWFADKLLACCRPSGVVIFFPSFYGRDP